MDDYLRARPAVEMLLGARVQLLGRKIARRPLRHYLGRIFATAASCVLRLPVYDTQCGAKLFRASAEMRPVFENPFLTRWLFDVELLARMIVAGADDRIHEFPLSQWQDVAGSKVKAKDFFHAAWQLGRIYREYPELRKRRTHQVAIESSPPVESKSGTNERLMESVR